MALIPSFSFQLNNPVLEGLVTVGACKQFFREDKWSARLTCCLNRWRRASLFDLCNHGWESVHTQCTQVIRYPQILASSHSSIILLTTKHFQVVRYSASYSTKLLCCRAEGVPEIRFLNINQVCPPCELCNMHDWSPFIHSTPSLYRNVDSTTFHI